VLLIDKPAGPTSHDAVAAIRRVLGLKRVGHAGTLDPPATGLLVVLVGRATRLSRFVGLLAKRYVGIIRFGSETTTDDAAGEPAGSDDRWRLRSREDVERAVELVRARPIQVPPAVSAKKVGGVRSWRRARRGEDPVLREVPVTIYGIEVSTWDPGRGEAGVIVECSGGTYVRAIARDVGRALGSMAHLAALRRTGIGDWEVTEALELAEVTAATVQSALRPMSEAVGHLPAIILPHAEAERCKHGQRLEMSEVAAGFDVASGPVAVFDSAGLIAVAETRAGVLHPEVVLAE
jgi:tRNA pseudouridine55 synthase